jgi:hypothetical protein
MHPAVFIISNNQSLYACMGSVSKRSGWQSVLGIKTDPIFGNFLAYYIMLIYMVMKKKHDVIIDEGHFLFCKKINEQNY